MDKENQEKQRVRLKGMGDSVCLSFDPAQPFGDLRAEVERLFTRMRHLAINARVILDVGDEDGHEELIEKLGNFLKETFGVASVSRPPRKPRIPEAHIRNRDANRSWQTYRSDVLMLTGRIRSGQKVTARKHLLIMGDVNPGAEVIAGGDILIMGSLRGMAAAGQPDNEGGIVLALDFQPTQIQIGKVVAAGLPSSPVKTAEFAHVEDGAIVVEDFLDANPFRRAPWPEVR